MKNRKPVTIVIPVYGHWKSLKACIKSLKKHTEPGLHKIMLVNDCGPKANFIEQKINKAISNRANFYYFRNPENLGFVGTCNRSVFELDKSDNDVLLLNSDAKVTAGFLSEMISVLYSKSNLGVVSPRSNNATIATIPLIAIQRGGIGARKSFYAYKNMRLQLPRFNEAPTAHGFCMLIRREVINEYGLFDTIFGKGYGEEVDLCQRIMKFGWKSVICNRAFAYHREAASFTKKTKQAMIAKNDKIIRERYPDYHRQIGVYLSENLEIESRILPLLYRLKEWSVRKTSS